MTDLIGLRPEAILSLISAAAFGSITKGAVLFLAGWLVTSLARRVAPAPRAAVWLIVVAGTLIFSASWIVRPAALPGLPPIHAPAASVEHRAAPPAGPAVPAPPPEGRTGGRTATRAPAPGVDGPAGLGAARAAVVLWSLGTLLLLARFALGRLMAGRLLRCASRSAAGDALAFELAGHTAARRAIEVWTSPSCGIPFTFGTRRPRVVVPTGFARWAGWKQRAVLLHELEHVRRRDAAMNAAVMAACSLVWFVPTVWAARRLLLHEQELACDERVLRSGIHSTDYAAGIVGILRGAASRPLIPAPSTSFGRKNMVKRRIERILAWPAQRARNLPGAGRAIALAFCLLLPVIGLLGADIAPGEPAPDAPSLFAAARNGTPAQVQAALSAGASINAIVPGAGYTPLMLAAASNIDPEVIRALVRAGARIDLRSTSLGATALMLAAKYNPNPDVIGALIEGGARLADRDNGDLSPLVYSTTNPNTAIAARLLKAGEDINETNVDGMTPLMYAARGQDPAMVRFLLEAGADGRMTSKAGNTAFDLAEQNPKLNSTVALALLDKARR